MSEALITWALTNVLLPLAATVLLGIASKAMLVINKKYHLDIQQKEVENAVNFVERMAENAIKANGQALSSSEKLTQAVDYVNKAIPGQNQEVIKKKIEAAVQQYKCPSQSKLGEGK